MPSLLAIDLRLFFAPAGPAGEIEPPSRALAGVAGRIERSFAIQSPFAPALWCIGAELKLDADAAKANGTSWLSATGNGREVDAAIRSCLGEAAELISQFERPKDVAIRQTPRHGVDGRVGGWIDETLGSQGRPLDWIIGFEAVSQRPSLIPADLCLRRIAARPSLHPIGALSSGVAAGTCFEAAAVRAVLELCERDALALWWLGGIGARKLPEAHPASKAGRALVEHLRRGVNERNFTLLDLGTDLGVPTLAAVSVDLQSKGLACGAAARLDPSEAAEAAVLEMCQMELAAPVAEAKRAERGEDALNDADRRHLRRAAYPTADCERLRPAGTSDLAERPPVGDGLEDLLARLAKTGIAVHLVDLTRDDIGVPVVRAVSGDLQPFSDAATTPRLRAARIASGRTRPAMSLPLF